MTSSNENVTTTREPEMIEAQTMQSNPDGFHPRLAPGAEPHSFSPRPRSLLSLS